MNKKKPIILGIILLVLALGTGVFLVTRDTPSSNPDTTSDITQDNSTLSNEPNQPISTITTPPGTVIGRDELGDIIQPNYDIEIEVPDVEEIADALPDFEPSEIHSTFAV